MRLAAILLGLTTVAAPLLAQPPAYTSDPKFQKEVAAAKQPHQKEYDRLDHWKRANKIAGGSCLSCLDNMLELEYRTGDTKAALATANTYEALVVSPASKAYAETLRGSILFHSNHDKPKPEQLVQADAEFKAALAHNPTLHTAAYLDGRTLALLNRDEEARRIFADYVHSVPAGDNYRLRAEHFAENPALARATMAPPFTVTTAEGKQFTLDDMNGRVVLVDFWATWCGPCNEELPHVRKIAQEFAGQPFVLISVSWDSDPAKWQQFIDRNGMTWNQFRDADHQLSTAYGVNSIPHYFTIDSDGVLQSEKIGSGSDIEGKLKKLVARASTASVPRTAPASAVPVPTAPASTPQPLPAAGGSGS